MPDTETTTPLILTQRRDFVAASKVGLKGVASSLIVQIVRRGDGLAPRYGITASKKIGNAVIRNRAKRRLREVVRLILSEQAELGADYVLIARHNTVSVDWAQLTADFTKALGRAANQAAPNQQSS